MPNEHITHDFGRSKDDADAWRTAFHARRKRVSKMPPAQYRRMGQRLSALWDTPTGSMTAIFQRSALERCRAKISRHAPRDRCRMRAVGISAGIWRSARLAAMMRLHAHTRYTSIERAPYRAAGTPMPHRPLMGLAASSAPQRVFFLRYFWAEAEPGASTGNERALFRRYDISSRRCRIRPARHIYSIDNEGSSIIGLICMPPNTIFQNFLSSDIRHATAFDYCQPEFQVAPSATTISGHFILFRHAQLNSSHAGHIDYYVVASLLRRARLYAALFASAMPFR